MGDLSTKAERLYKVRKALVTREERFKKETETLFAEEAALKADVLDGLKSVNLASVRVRSGDTFFITKRKSFAITNPISMQKWAMKNRLVVPDKDLVKQKLKKLVELNKLPDFAELTEVDTISVRHKEPEGKKKK